MLRRAWQAKRLWLIVWPAWPLCFCALRASLVGHIAERLGQLVFFCVDQFIQYSTLGSSKV